VSNVVLGIYATVGGGIRNEADGPGAFIGGGGYDGSVVAGNTATGASSAIAGGTHNLASGSRSTVGGGHNNSATNWYATVPGGAWNIAGGMSSFAAGQTAKALHDGAFVWGDTSTLSDITSTANNQFTARCAGGVRFFSNTGASVGVQLAAGANAWSVASDRNLKENFTPVDCRAVLEKVAALPITSWNLKSQPADIHHIGPMAQDFSLSFAVGEDDRHISTSDADGVALAAIQGLNQKLNEKDAEIQGLKQSVAELKAMVEKLAGK
jgi:hypothetical protein